MPADVMDADGLVERSEHLGPLSGPGTAVMASLPSDEYPLLAATARHAQRVPPDAEFRRGLTVMLRGLRPDVTPAEHALDGESPTRGRVTDAVKSGTKSTFVLVADRWGACTVGGSAMAVDVGRVGVWSTSSLWEGDDGGEVAAELDELGFGALWLGGAKGDLNLPQVLLGDTSRLALATGIVNIWTEPVETTSAAYHRIATKFPDRLLLGIGAGHKKLVEPMTGQRYVRPYQQLVAYLDALDTANVPRAGRAVAALGPKVLALAGQRSAGAHPYLTTPEHTHQAREILGAGPLLAPEQTVILETDPDKARAIARSKLELYLGLPNYTNNWLRLGYTEDDLAGGGSDRLVDGLVAWGDVDTVLTRISQHHQAGADHVCIQVLTDDDRLPREQFRILGEALFS